MKPALTVPLHCMILPFFLLSPTCSTFHDNILSYLYLPTSDALYHHLPFTVYHGSFTLRIFWTLVELQRILCSFPKVFP
jgi:hypothetical protein